MKSLIPISRKSAALLVTGESKKGPAICKLVADALMLKRREKLAQKFISGEWGVELKGFEAAQVAEQRTDQKDEKRWRD